MELPFEKTVSRFWQQKRYAPVMREETQELRLTEDLPDIGRVIAAWGQPVLRGKEWRRDHIALTGGIMVWVLYAPEGGGEPVRLESWLPFSARVDHDHDADGVIRAECILSSADARSLSARKLMLRAGVGLMVQTMEAKEAELYRPGELPGDIELLDRTYPMILTKETGERTFLCEETVRLPQGMEPEKLIYYRLVPRVTEQKVLGSRAVFKGVGELHLLCRDREGRMFAADLEVPFAQYLDLDRDYEDSAEISNMLCVTSLEAELCEGGVHVRCGLVSQYIVNDRATILALEDAYSPLRELELVKQEVTLPAWLEEQVREAELQQQLTSDEVPVDMIFFPDLPTVTRQPGGAEVGWGGSFQILTEKDGMLSSRAMKANQSLRLDTACDTIPCTWLRGGVKSRREGSGWSVEAQMGLRLDSVCTRPLSMIAGIRAGECQTPDPDRPSVILRARKPEETLWDIAKYCGSTVSAIQRLNKLEQEPEENRLLLIPVI